MEYRTIDLFYPFSSEMFQQRIADEINEIERRGWGYAVLKISWMTATSC